METVEEELNEVIEAEESNSGEDSGFVMPEKFKGKSAEEIAQSNLELERKLGLQGNELGDLRKLTDQYIHQELSKREDPKENDSPVEFDDLVENPKEVISSVVKKELESVNQKFDQMTALQRHEKFLTDNPDFQEIDASQEFYNWANASPYRARQLMAANSGDYDAADEVLQSYRDQVKGMQEAAKQGEKVKRDSALKDASTETAGTGVTSDKIYKRTDLIRLQMSDPEKYWAMQDEIHQAYAEGRVK